MTVQQKKRAEKRGEREPFAAVVPLIIAILLIIVIIIIIIIFVSLVHLC